MKPIKSLIPLAKWLLRITAVVIVYQTYFYTAISFSFKGLGYFIALAMFVFVVLLVIGGFMKTAKLTVVSSLLILVTCLVVLFGVAGFSIANLFNILPLASIAFYFMSRGNIG
jgi:hypothetical protein